MSPEYGFRTPGAVRKKIQTTITMYIYYTNTHTYTHAYIYTYIYTYVYTYTQMYIYIYICRTVLPAAPPLRGGRRAGNDTTAALRKFSDEADKRRSSSSHVLQEQEQKPQTTPTCPTNKQTNKRPGTAQWTNEAQEEGFPTAGPIVGSYPSMKNPLAKPAT